MASIEIPHYWLTRFLFQRALGFIYFIGFLIIFNQFKALCGSHGLLPARLFLQRLSFWDAPSLFWINISDAFLTAMAVLGLALSFAAMVGLSDAAGIWTSVGIWGSLWVLYLSFVNIGQTFYGFGWESLLLETGFLAVFLGPSRSQPPVVVIWLLRWVLFRLMFGAGLIKIRGDECWRDLTCMQYHYETQPMPNPLSWYFHHLPVWAHKAAALFTHFVELPLPFLYFGPRFLRHPAGLITILFQLTLILSGNLSWLNYITIVLCISCLDDSFWSRLLSYDPSRGSPVAGVPAPAIYALAGLVAVLSVKPVLNLLSRSQMMNTSFDSLHLVNTYGAFGSVTRTRYEVVIEGSADAVETPATQWREYLFKGKPGEVDRMPPIVSPYHLRLDWQMWFAAMSPYWDHPWIVNLLAKLLQGDREVLGLLRKNPFPERPPRLIRAELYEYHFTDRFTGRSTSPLIADSATGSGDSSGIWWHRRRVGWYFPPVSLGDSAFLRVLEQQGWWEPSL